MSPGRESRSVGAPAAPATIHGRFFEAARAHPDACALVGSTGSLRYRELAAAAAAWTRLLLDRGVRPREVVAVRAGRALDLPAALLGILAAGACYSVLDPNWPPERQRDLLTRMGVRTCLVDPALEPPAVEGVTTLPLRPAAALAAEPGAGPREVSPDDPACMFWTSGSTGLPKGVLSPHRATTRLFAGGVGARGGPGRVMVSVSAPAWDAFSVELWSMLSSGGCTVLHEPTYFLPSDLRAAVDGHGVTDLILTAGLFDVFVTEDVSAFAGLEHVSVGGDRLSPLHAGTFLSAFPDVPLVNLYGPVECCAFVTTRRVTAEDLTRPEGVSIGSAVPGTEVFLVEDGEVVPRGAEGEIWVTGAGVGLGYLGDPERTRESFGTVGHGAFPGPCYRTGDRGRMTDDGALLFLGRLDRQVKVAGQRIEPAEAEGAALRLGCRQAAAVPVPGRHGYRGLALFVVPGDYQGTPRDLRAALSVQLPAAAVPWPIRFLDGLPLTPNAKVDRAQLTSLLGVAR